jgi:hypothetical protein
LLRILALIRSILLLALFASVGSAAAPLNVFTLYYWRVTAVSPGGNTLATSAPFQFQTVDSAFPNSGFIGSSGGCGQTGPEGLIPIALLPLRRRLRNG